MTMGLGYHTKNPKSMWCLWYHNYVQSACTQ